MEKSFYQFLVQSGYREFTPSGNKSTVYSYCKKINLVCDLENMTWAELAQHIRTIIPKYDQGGSCEEVGLTSHGTCINALRAYGRFCKINGYF